MRVLTGTSVWVAPDPHTLLLSGPPGRVRAGAIVLATGAYDRPVAFPGWTLPGALTAGAAQALAKGQGVLPGKRVLLAGAGPFLLPVARQLAESGAEVVAIAEATRRRDWLRAAPRMAANPGRLVDYAEYRARVPRIPWGQVSCAPTATTASGRPRSPRPARTGARSEERERAFAVDAVCTAYGFLRRTSTSPARSAATCHGDAVAHDADMRTSRRGRLRRGRGVRRRRRRPRARGGRAGRRGRRRRTPDLARACAGDARAARRLRRPSSPTCSTRGRA